MLCYAGSQVRDWDNGTRKRASTVLSKAGACGMVPPFAAYVLMRVLYNMCLMLEGNSGYQMSFSEGLSCSWSEYFTVSTVMMLRLCGNPGS